MSADEDVPEELEDFHITGEVHTRVKYGEETVNVRRRKKSADLAKRYGFTPPRVEVTYEFERSKLLKDDFPDRGAETIKQEWNSYYGMEDEWRDLFNESSDVGVAHSHNPYEEDSAMCTWIYEEDGAGGYDTTSPINVVFDLGAAGETTADVGGVLNMAGWTHNVAEYTRWAWNSIDETFEAHHESAATDEFGAAGRHHVRYWTFGSWPGICSMQAHEDEDAPHEDVVSYDSTKGVVMDIFEDDGWNVEEYGYGLGNPKGDHDGWAAKID